MPQAMQRNAPVGHSEAPCFNPQMMCKSTPCSSLAATNKETTDICLGKNKSVADVLELLDKCIGMLALFENGPSAFLHVRLRSRRIVLSFSYHGVPVGGWLSVKLNDGTPKRT